MNEFAACDRAILSETYDFLERMFVVLRRHSSEGSADTAAQVRSFVAAASVDELVEQVRQFGVTSLAQRYNELMAKTIHDLRGGALTALLGELQLAQLRSLEPLNARQMFFLTRDHLKIMRNALLGLDDAKRRADLLPKMHSVDLIAEKWQHALLENPERRTRLEVRCDFHGNIAECCVEFGALDRVLYNLVNNACRHTASGKVKLTINPPPDGLEEPENLRFCVSNPVSARDEEHLAAHDNLSELFAPGVSSTGSGYGLTIAADFVTNAFGLPDRAHAVDGGYLGARLIEQEFGVWFHWPVAADV